MDYELIIISVLSLLYFISASINKILNFNTVVLDFIKQTTPILKYFLSSPPPYILYQLVILGVILLQLVGSSIVIFAAYNKDRFAIFNTAARTVLYLLIVFSVLATLIYHLKPEKIHLIISMANISVSSGLWLLSKQFK
jgi:hypothetical protein